MDHHKPTFPLPTEGELVAFPHGAAGHQGLSSNAAGDLIIKPCTQAEIDFYEAAKDHPEFQAHMPVYMGKLELGNKAAAVQDSASVVEHEDIPAAVIAEAGTDKETARSADLQEGTQTLPEKKEEKPETKAWVPSGGKKLETGLAIVLENAAASFKRPNVIDLKLGSRLWADDAPEDKRQKLDQVAAETTSGSLGFRVAGAKIWLGNKTYHAEVEAHTEIKDGYKTYDKHYGRNLDDQTVQKAVARFFCGSIKPGTYGRTQSKIAPETRTLIEKLTKELKSIQYVLEHEESRMYSASVLIVVEGEPEAFREALAAEAKLDQEKETAGQRPGEIGTEDAGDKDEDGEGDDDDDGDDGDDDEESVAGPKLLEVRLIDFAHAAFTPGQGPDQNALKGVRSIIEILEDVNK